MKKDGILVSYAASPDIVPAIKKPKRLLQI